MKTESNKKEIIICPPGRQISAYLREKGGFVPTPCGGHGNCGKCRVKVLEGDLPVMRMDKVHLSETEIKAGIRLACQAMPKGQVCIEVLSTISLE